MAKIAIFQVKETEGEEGLFQFTKDTFETTEEAKKHLRFAGMDGQEYQIAQLSARVKCEKITTMKLIETKGEKEGNNES